MISPTIAAIRKEYQLMNLDEKNADRNPFVLFEQWWKAALEASIEEANAMTLATSSANRPHARIVLLKHFDADGFVFFTNYESAKGNELNNNPYAALVFFWKELERQIRIEGSIEKTSIADSDKYFQERPAGSKIGAWASQQSAIIPYRAVVEQNAQQYEKIFAGENIPRPEHWGGYRLIPTLFEFWQGRPNRLHDRLQYHWSQTNNWERCRLAP